MRAAWLLLTMAMVSATARADEPSEPTPAAREQAIELGKQARELYDQGRWDDAYDRFSRAESLVHSPVFVLYLARSSRNAQRLIEARAAYRRLVSERIPATAPEPWREAQADAVTELAEVERRIPALRITVQTSQGLAAPDAAVSLDGRAVDPTARVAPLEVDPGPHHVVASRAGVSADREVVAVERVKVTDVLLTLPGPAPHVGTLPEPRFVVASAPQARTNSALRSWGITSITVGSILLAVGVGTGVAAIAADKSLESLCPGGDCPQSAASQVTTYYALGNTASATLVIGGALTAGGIVMVAVGSRPTRVGLSPLGSYVTASF
jgi:hypothetical protein